MIDHGVKYVLPAARNDARKVGMGWSAGLGRGGEWVEEGFTFPASLRGSVKFAKGTR